MIKQAKLRVVSAFTTRTVSGFGLVISNEHGSIAVLTGSKWSPAKHSITEFIVHDEQARGQGYGDKLLTEAIRRFPHDLGGQCSSKSSVALMHKHGFRMFNNPDSTLQEAFQKMQEDSSVYMRLV